MSGLLRPWMLLLVGLCAAAMGLYFSDWVEVTANEGFSREARRNPYLAAERFLERFGVAVEARDGLQLLDGLPPAHHTLLIASSRRALSQRRTDALLAWVRRGGRLILLATEIWDPDAGASGDKLLDELGFRLFEAEATGVASLANLPQALLERLPGTAQCGSDRALTRVSFADEPQAVRVALDDRRFLGYQGSFEASYADNAAGPQLFYVDVGDGAVVVMTSLRLWRNLSIGCHDHAHLLRWLTEDREVLGWLYNTEMAPLPVLLWQRWPVAMVLAGVWLVAWGWRSAVRPIRPQPTLAPERRQLMEHLDGVARFCWRQGDSLALLDGMRCRLVGDKEPDAERIAELAAASGLPAERVRWALTLEDARADQDFVEAARVLHRLSRSAAGSAARPTQARRVS